jgi:hypothetical protein
MQDLKGEIQLDKFCDKVDDMVEEQYGFTDGGDLCWNLTEMGIIDPAAGVDEAARVVAMALAMP